MMELLKVLLVLVGLFGKGSPYSFGTDFVFGIPESFEPTSTDFLRIHISALTTTAVNIVSPGIHYERNITATGSTTTTLQLPLTDIVTGSGISSRGVYIHSEKDISIQVIIRDEHTTDGFLVLPYTELSTEYFVASYTPEFYSEFVVTAVGDGTSVTVTFRLDSGYARFNGRNYRSGDTLTTTLDGLQTLEVQSVGDLTGTRVTSNKPVTMTSGNKCAYVPVGVPACDYLIEQMPPVAAWRNMYLTTALKTRANNRFRVISSVDHNLVRIGNVKTVILNMGEHYEHVDSNNQALNIRGDHPILVLQYAEGTIADGAVGDPSMIVVPSQLDYGSESVFITEDGVPKHYVSITIKTSDIDGLRLDGRPINGDDMKSVDDVDETGVAVSYTIIRIEVTHGQHQLWHSNTFVQFAAILYGFGDAESYGYPLGYNHAPTLQELVGFSCSTSGWHIEIDMPKLEIRYPGSTASDIYLGDLSCNGRLVGDTLVLDKDFDECTTNTEERPTEIVYIGELGYAYHDPNNPFIIRNYNWTLAVRCHVQRYGSAQANVTRNDTSIDSQGSLNSTTTYAIVTQFYSDINYRQEISGNPLNVNVGSNVFVKSYVQTTDFNVKMWLHSCYSIIAGTKYFLIENGCESDPNTHYLSQSDHETKFVFQVFEVVGTNHDIYVTCEAILCDVTDTSASQQCDQTPRCP